MTLFESAVQLGSFCKSRLHVVVWTGENVDEALTELFENVDVTASIYYVSEHEVGSSGIVRAFCLAVFFC